MMENRTAPFLRCLRNLFVVIFALLFSSCANVPTKQFVHTGPTYKQSMPKIARVAIINDVCIARDAIGSDDYFSIEDSQVAESFMLAGAKEYLQQKGYEVVLQQSPFVGAFKKPDTLFKVAQREGTEVSDKYSPFYISDSLLTDEPYKQALIKVITQVLQSVEQQESSPSEVFLSKENMQKSLDVIAKRTDADIVLFLIGQGVIVPKGKSVAQGITTAAITTALTLGWFTYARWNVSYLDTYAGLVDLKTGEVLWSNSFRHEGGGFTDREYYSKQWPTSLLYHIPPSSK